ncbi:peptidyl-Lys metalloendopeptidase [Pleurotus eryngii]|uniref:Peptidyl-Lys metalloendopeptidase n=1 Tax=Pleurotus eryngii TaxID=5323 RepID=A0A9P6AAC2_PLEER|nr:peptidyl-Lys metalloendopeptidase [Pleurotus eryngii]
MQFSSSVRSALAAVFVAALSVSASPALTLKVAGPDSVNGVDNLKIVTTLVNTGDETLKILNDPRGPLSTLPTDTFSITDATGARPAFTGVKAKYVPAHAASLDDASVFTILAPGETIDVAHDLSTTYNFTATGEGAYNFEARNLFHIVDSDKTITPLYADVEPHAAKISGKLAVAKSALQRRATFVGCSATRQTQLNAAASQAQTYAANALSYLNSHTSSTTRYTTWFGTFVTSRYNTVLSHFSSISSNTFSSYTFDCTCSDAGTYAFVSPSNFGYVTLCGAFWNAPVAGTDSRGGTLIHESSHFTRNGGTDDHVYGQSGAQSLARSNPAQAIDNADSHEYFAENNPALA